MTLDNDNPLAKQNGEIRKRNKYTKSQWLIFVTLALGNFCAGASLSLQGPFFPEEAESKGATPSEYGFIFGIFQLTVFVAAPLMGKLIRYMEAKFVLNAGVFMNGFACVLFGFLEYVDDRTTFVSLGIVIRIVEGLGTAALRTSAYATIAAQFPDSMGTIFATLETFLGIGYAIGPTVGGALYDLGGFGLPFYFIGSLLVVDAVIIFAFFPKSQHSSDNRKGDMLKFWMHPSTFIRASAIFSSTIYIGYFLVSFEPHVREFHLQGLYIGMLFAVTAVSYALLSPCFGWLCDKNCNTELISAIGYLSEISSLILIGPMPFLKLENGIVTSVLALFLLGMQNGAQNVAAFSGSLKDLKSFIGPSVGGYVMDSMGFDAGINIILFVNVVFLFLLLLYATVGKRLLFRADHSMERKPILQMD